ncbi:iron donor protein CyaY [Vulgatibacter sp.]|uniref:iron donor protein CyaY n=1 Tax=Vulgatibacter sp. TaxID=1971226 RepID=UPI0035638D7E
MSDLTEPQYLKLADQAFRRIQDALEPVDPDDADYEFNGDVLTIGFANGVKCVINTQRPARQIWLAAKARAWHFSWDEGAGKWMDDKGSGDDLFGLLQRIVQENAGATIRL